jgi:hypothetical protein
MKIDSLDYFRHSLKLKKDFTDEEYFTARDNLAIKEEKLLNAQKITIEQYILSKSASSPTDVSLFNKEDKKRYLGSLIKLYSYGLKLSSNFKKMSYQYYDYHLFKKMLKIIHKHQPELIDNLRDYFTSLINNIDDDIFLLKTSISRHLYSETSEMYFNNLVSLLKYNFDPLLKMVNINSFFYFLHSKNLPGVPALFQEMFNNFNKFSADIMIDVDKKITNYLLACYQKNLWLMSYFISQSYKKNSVGEIIRPITKDKFDNLDVIYYLS